MFLSHLLPAPLVYLQLKCSLPTVCRRERLEAIGSQLTGSYSLWEHWSGDERLHHVLRVLKVHVCVSHVYCIISHVYCMCVTCIPVCCHMHACMYVTCKPVCVSHASLYMCHMHACMCVTCEPVCESLYVSVRRLRHSISIPSVHQDTDSNSSLPPSYRSWV